MTACRASAVALAAAGLALAASPAFAQGGPIRLTPPLLVDPANPAPLGAPAARPEPAPIARDAVVRDEGAPPPLDFDAAGTLDAAHGGLPATLWTGSKREEVDPLLRDAPAAQASAALRGLLVRVLVSPGPPPTASDGADKLAPFLGLRAARLLQLGDADSALQLARAGGRRENDPAADRVRRDAGFLAGDVEGACAVAREAVARHAGADWPSALIACQALAGDLPRAQLGLDMLREAKQPQEPWLARLVAAVAGDAKSLTPPPTTRLPAYALPLLGAVKASPPATALASAEPAMLAAIARLPSATPETRLAAAERATALGALDGNALAEAYGAATIAPRDAGDPFAFAERDRGPRGRAALFQHAKAQPPGPVRAEALRRALRLAQARGAWRPFAEASADLAAEIEPAGELAEAAPELVRVLLATGRVREAGLWVETLRATVGPTALDAAAAAGPLLWLADADPGAISIEHMTEWRFVQEAADKPRLAQRAALLGALIEALGEPAPGPLSVAAPARPAAATPAPAAKAPDAALISRLATAAREGRKAETVLLAAALLGPDGVNRAPTAATVAAIRALTEAGFADPARALALEAALAGGL